MTPADQIVVINAGRIEQVGSPEELYQHPQTIFVATFIDSPKMNLLTGLIAEERGATTYGIRPEHLSLTEEGGWAAQVKFTEYLGNETIVYLTSELRELTLRINGNQRSGTGDTVRVFADKAHEHFFDVEGQRIS
jgi:multiple sugar transport system ATP-binding protein